MLSYTKAILDYNISTQYKEKILEKKLTLSKIKIYIPSDAVIEWRESIAQVKGYPKECADNLLDFAKKLSACKGCPPVVVKVMNNRYKLAGDYCIRLSFKDGDEIINFPADPEIITLWDPELFIKTYTKIFNAYSVSKNYVEKIRNRKIILKDEF